MKNLLNIFVTAALMTALLGCNSEQNQTDENAAASQDNNTYLANTVANFEIEGMECAVMCGGKIKESLTSVSGIVSCDVDFDNKQAVVKFDNKLTNKDALVQVIQQLNNGQFKVTDASEKNLDSNTDQSMNSGSNPEQTIEVSAPQGFQFPNIFDALIEMF
ncbi:MAG: heavy metal-associated domain-containing protein [Flavobacteriales bacterium]|nr:heavy metal-associated domain-containing protein [Flavobacteriales bacterium]